MSRFDENFSRDYTKIKFVTEGILIREMMGDPLLNNYSVIMLDEVHERTAQIDIIMGLLKKILKRRRRQILPCLLLRRTEPSEHSGNKRKIRYQ